MGITRQKWTLKGFSPQRNKKDEYKNNIKGFSIKGKESLVHQNYLKKYLITHDYMIHLYKNLSLGFGQNKFKTGLGVFPVQSVFYFY